jgi:hypothetical protein
MRRSAMCSPGDYRVTGVVACGVYTAGTLTDVAWRRCWLLGRPLPPDEGDFSPLDDGMLQISS